MARKPRVTDLAPRKGSRELNIDVQYWLDEISACRKREKDYRTNGMRIREIYAGDKGESTPMNILFSNTETISPALYSQIPRPVVRRRYKDNDPVGFAAAKAGQRLLEFLLDTNIEGYDTVDECLKSVTLDALLPGRGISSLKYDAAVDYVDDGQDEDGKAKTMPVKRANSELVCPEIRSWDRVYFGYARKWSKVPWVAYEEHIDKAEAKRLFGEEKTRLIKFTKGETSDNESRQGLDRSSQDERNTGARKTALIYQIWDKSGGQKIRYISPAYKDGYLLVADDELKITGFFNCPRPVRFIEKTDELTPTSPYMLYENQAKELNSLTLRISKITSAIKARGVYDTELGDDIANIMEADDNQLVAADKSSSLAAEKGLQNAIWFMPLDVLITTLRELVAAREQCKQVIYEITGISDIIRGASKASETLGAQQIKSQWGTLRIKPKQAEVQRYACDMLRIMLEIAAQKFSEATWAKMTGLQYLTTAQIQQGQQMLTAAQGQLQEATAMLRRLPQPLPSAPPPGANGGGPPDAQAQLMAQKAAQSAALATRAITPEQQQAIQINQQKAQQAQAQIQQIQQIEQSTPKWPEVLASLKDDIQRAYKIDIETNSTIEPEAAEDQKNIADLMQALSQFLQSVGPMVAQGIMPFQVAQSMLLSITRRFRFGDEIEEMIQQMKPPEPQDKSAEALKAAQGQLQQLQAQLAQKELDGQKRELENKKTTTDQQTQLDKLTASKDITDRETQLALERQKLDSDRKLFAQEKQHATDKIISNTKVASTELSAKQQAAKQSEQNAQRTHKDAEAVTAKVDQKVEQAVEKLSDMIDEMKDIDKGLSEKVAIAKVLQLSSAPRKRTVQRGKDGRAEALIDEPPDNSRFDAALASEVSAQETHKSTTAALKSTGEALKEIENKVNAVGEGEKKIAESIASLSDSMKEFQTRVQQQLSSQDSKVSKQMESHRADTVAMVKKLSGPRKKTAQRGPDGRIQSVVDEPVN